MNRSRNLTVALIAAAALATTTACGSSTTEPAASPSSPPPSSPAAVAGHNQADVNFAHHMIPHHEQAIEMSDMILAKSGIDPRVSDLATHIVSDQGREIEQMQQWLQQWGMPTMAMTPGMGMPGMDMPGMGDTESAAPPPAGGESPHHGDTPSTGAMPNEPMMPNGTMMPSESMMPGMGDMPMGGMMGMMSPADMEALQQAQGEAASKLFLTQMIEHHQGAITMAKNEIDKGQFAAAISMAESIVTSQQKEIDTMNQILSSLGGP